MRVPLEWLHDYVDPAMDVQSLADRLALSGTAVERIEHHGVPSTDNFVVGRVLTRVKHPNADRLSLCTVDVGAGEPSQIVCGAPNVTAGLTVAVARPGAVLPDGSVLRSAKLRGLESQGMILSERELQISGEHNGIMVLGAGSGSGSEDGTGADAAGRSGALAPGTPLAQVLSIATDVLVLEITPNRPDCLGIYGVAREVAACTGAALKPPPWVDDPGSLGALSGIEIERTAPAMLCPRFTARIFEHVKVGESPLWLKARLMACGQRPVSNVVDITNYVMLATGQPMHAFDYDRVAGARLRVRTARAGEQVQTLDGQTRTLDEQMVVIEDADGPTSIAGVMGGARSEVHAGTTRVLSEAASWSGPNIQRTSLALALRSEASGRFEKGLQVEQTLRAQALTSRLMTRLCSASVRAGTLDIGGPGPAPRTIRLRDARTERLLGVTVPRARARRHLEAIGFTATDAPDGLDVSVPDFRRADVTREADLIEEVARLDGLERLPATLPSAGNHVGVLTALQRQRRRAVDALAAQGLLEVIGWSFTGPEQARKLRLLDAGSPVTLANPLSSEQSQLRTRLFGSLLDIAQRNRARGAGAIAIFESGAVYRSKFKPSPERLPQEPQHLAALLCGPLRAPSWREQSPPTHDFFSAKGVLDGLFAALGIRWELGQRGGRFLHPGRSVQVLVAGEPVGWVGELHPSVAAEWDFSDTLAGFEIELSALPLPAVPRYSEIGSFPAVREDLAVVVAEPVSAAQVLDVVRNAGSPLLAGADIFDVYRDSERLGQGVKSLALRLSYRAADRTLTDEEVAARRARITRALEQRLEGRVRTGESGAGAAPDAQRGEKGRDRE